MGAPLRPRQRLAELEQVALTLLRAVGVRVLVIDELQNVLAGRGETRREFLNLIRFLGNELRIPLVGVGTREAYLAIRSDDQLENRFESYILPRWEPDEEACSLLASFAASFPLRRRSSIATIEMARYLLTRSEGTIGEVTHLLTDAALAAIESGEEAINQRTLLMAAYVGPSERRRLFERELASVRGGGRCTRRRARAKRCPRGCCESQTSTACPWKHSCATTSERSPTSSTSAAPNCWTWTRVRASCSRSANAPALRWRICD
jgi:hypothetical protein